VEGACGWLHHRREKPSYIASPSGRGVGEADGEGEPSP